ncbi:MFS transporter [Nitratireductor sp. CAU 1489]|uniref:MFS transporter n=1 Tax=Nitratireductor arenosus TaxID=2682096 RepID=A0A844QEN1_9HYPH|nr:MFS transporter [Nitratireductor arenosus]MVA96441.1 MFS transporter [Nitratireductor arenosus]
MPATETSFEDLRRGRWAVAAIFLVNGFLVGSWAPQIPVTLDRLQISEFTLGLLILGFGAGALIAMPTAGYLIARHGSTPVVRALAFACSFGLLGVALAPGLASVALALLVFGALIGGTDVSMNANAVAVERRLGRAIMSSSHGFWSLGGFVGGGLGGFAIVALGHVGHALVVTAIALLATLVATRHLSGEASPEVASGRRFSLPRNPLVYLVGLIALFSMVPEGAVLDWAALYLRQERGADLATAGLAFAGFSGTMALMRFAGDMVRDRLGAVATLRVSGLVAAAGMMVAAWSPDPALAIVAFALSGLGIANMVPIAFSAAGNQDDISAGAGLSTVTSMGYAGLLVAPSVIGFIGEHTGFAPIFAVLSGLLVLVVLMAGLARKAEFAQGGPSHSAA